MKTHSETAEQEWVSLVAENATDYDILIEGVSQMFLLQQEIAETNTVNSLIDHYKLHPEDKWCQIYRPSDQRIVLCRRAGILAIERIARRLVHRAPNKEDLSVTKLNEIISKRVLEVATDGVTDDEELTNRLLSYVATAEAEHVEQKYHFPCVLAHTEDPPHFCFGPVSFTTAKLFIEEIELRRQAGSLTFDDGLVPQFAEQAKKHGWVASILIPPCSPDVSKSRAEHTVELALGMLKIFIGIGYAKGIRLPHTSPAQHSETSVLIQRASKLSWTWHGPSLQSALVGDNWFAQIPAGYRKSGSHVLQASTFGKRSEIATRIIDSIRWFSDASYEVTAGVQIAKWIASLERLTTVANNFKAHVFCKRVAILAAADQTPAAMEEAYRNARLAYRLRCEVMHGSKSQDDERFAKNSSMIHDLTRFALMRALEVHCLLDDPGKLSDKKKLIRFFEKAERPFTALFISLGQQYDDKAKAKPSSGPNSAT